VSQRTIGSTGDNGVTANQETRLMNKERKRAAVVGGLTGIVMALVLSLTHNSLVGSAHSADSKTTQTSVVTASTGNGAGYFRGFDRLDDTSSTHPPHVM